MPISSSPSNSDRTPIIASILVSVLLALAASWAGIGFFKQRTLREEANAQSLRAEEAAEAAQQSANRAARAREQSEELLEFVLKDLRIELQSIGRTALLGEAANKVAAYFENLPSNLVTTETELRRSQVLVTIAHSLHNQGKLDEAMKRYDTSVAILQNLTTKHPGNRRYQLELGWTLTEMGLTLNAREDYTQAGELFLRTQKLYQALIKEDPANSDGYYGLAKAAHGMGDVARYQNYPNEALQSYETAATQLRQLLETDPQDILTLQMLGVTLNNTGLVYSDLEDFKQAEQVYLEAYAVSKRLADADRETRRWHKEVATALNNVGITLHSMHDYPRAEKYLKEAMELRRGLADWDPMNGEWLDNYGNSWHNLAALYGDLDRTDEARTAAKEVIKTLHRLHALDASYLMRQDGLQDSPRMLVEALTEHGRDGEARSLLQTIFRLAHAIHEDNPTDIAWGNYVASLCSEALDLARAHDDQEQVLELRKQIVRIRVTAFNTSPKSMDTAYRLALAYGGLASTFRDTENLRASLWCYQLTHYLLKMQVDESHRSRERYLTKSQQDHYKTAIALGQLPPPRRIISPGEEWRYWDRREVQDAWTMPNFDDTPWRTGRAPLGYGNRNESTVISYGDNPDRKNLTAWFRKVFDYDGNEDPLSSIHLNLLVDDGAVVYLNGKEILRSGMPQGKITATTLSSQMIQGDDEKTFVRFIFEGEQSLDLQNGENVLAIEVHQNEAISSDLSFELELTHAPPEVAPLDHFPLEEVIRLLGDLVPARLLSELELQPTKEPSL